jgi:hypothetical protein
MHDVRDITIASNGQLALVSYEGKVREYRRIMINVLIKTLE